MKLHPWLGEEEKEYQKRGTALSLGDHAELVAEGHRQAEQRAYQASVWTGTVQCWDGPVQLAGHGKALEAFSPDGGVTWHLLSEEQRKRVNCWTAKDGPLQRAAQEGWMVKWAPEPSPVQLAADLLDMLFEEHGLYKD